MKKVAILLLNYNGKDWIIDCIKSIYKSNFKDFDIVIVDNGSVDGSPFLIKKLFPEIILIENTSNLGYCKGFNIALEYSKKKKYKFALVLNNDSVIDNYALDYLLETSSMHNNVALITGKVLDFDTGNLETVGKYKDKWQIVGENIGFGEFDHGQYDYVREREFCDDNILLYPLKIFDKVGFYDEMYFLYFDEVDLQMKAKKNNVKIIYDYRCIIEHKGGLSSGQGPNKIKSFYLSRNQILFLKTHGSSIQKFRMIFNDIIFGIIRLYFRNLFKRSDNYDIFRIKGKLDALYYLVSASKPPEGLHDSLK